MIMENKFPLLIWPKNFFPVRQALRKYSLGRYTGWDFRVWQIHPLANLYSNWYAHASSQVELFATWRGRSLGWF